MRRLRTKVFLSLCALLVGLFSTVAYAVAATFGSRTLLVGTTGDDVAVLQALLNQLGHQAGSVDGIFGSRTRNGVTGFQQAGGLTPDGIVGPRTFGALDRARSTGTTNRYLVRSGDSLYWIALRYGTTVADLREANRLAGDVIYPGQFLALPGVPPAVPWSALPEEDRTRPLAAAWRERGLSTRPAGLLVVVDKSDQTLTLFAGDNRLKSYHVELGDGGPGDKERAGDHRTPEGRFSITEALVLDPPDQFLGTRWLRLSYPGVEDARRGRQDGLITEETYEEIVAAAAALATPPQRTALGGGIGIHGGSVPEFGSNWTWGCVGLTNEDVEELYDYVGVGTPVVITP